MAGSPACGRLQESRPFGRDLDFQLNEHARGRTPSRARARQPTTSARATRPDKPSEAAVFSPADKPPARRHRPEAAASGAGDIRPPSLETRQRRPPRAAVSSACRRGFVGPRRARKRERRRTRDDATTDHPRASGGLSEPTDDIAVVGIAVDSG
jgi:hypothetical protein